MKRTPSAIRSRGVMRVTHYSRRHLPDRSLLDQAARHHSADVANTAELLADIAEIDVRRLYSTEGYPSLHVWLIDALGMDEDVAWKRIQAARLAVRFRE